MKVSFIFILYFTPREEIDSLKKEIKNLNLSDYSMHFIDNSYNGYGYAHGVNEGLKKALKENADIFVIANPDISLKETHGKKILAASKFFDIWGFCMLQNNKRYYCGELDAWRMSSKLVNKKPNKRFQKCEYITGSLMLIKKAVVKKIGFFDESYFMYYEDVDYCMRAKKENFKIGIDSEVNYKHFELSKKNKNKNYYLAKNRLKFLMKYGTTLQKVREIIRLPKTLIEERKTIANRIRTGPFLFNFLSLNISSAINRILTFILFFFLIRYFSVEDYGIYILVWAHVGILSPILDLGTTSYSLIYISSEKMKKYNSLLSLRLILSLIVFPLNIILGIILYNKVNITLYIILTSFVIFSNMWFGSYLILTSIKEKNYLAAIMSSIFMLILVVFLILSLIFTKNILLIFVLVFILYNLYSIINILLIKKEINIKFTLDYSNWLYIIKKSYIFVLITFFAGIYFKFDVVLLKLLQSEHDVGIYSAGYKFFEALIFIASSYTFTAIPILAKLVNKDLHRFFERVKRDVLLLGAIGILTSTAVYLLTPMFLPLILKSNYLPSQLVLRIVIFALPFIFISTIFMNALYVLKKIYIVLLLFIFQTIFNLTLNYIFIPQYSYLASAYITVVGEALNALLLILILIKIKKNLNISPIQYS